MKKERAITMLLEKLTTFGHWCLLLRTPKCWLFALVCNLLNVALNFNFLSAQNARKKHLVRSFTAIFHLLLARFRGSREAMEAVFLEIVLVSWRRDRTMLHGNQDRRDLVNNSINDNRHSSCFTITKRHSRERLVRVLSLEP